VFWPWTNIALDRIAIVRIHRHRDRHGVYPAAAAVMMMVMLIAVVVAAAKK